MPTYRELVDMVGQLEKKTVVMASMVESKPSPLKIPHPHHGMTSRVFFVFFTAAIMFTAYSSPERVDYYAGDYLMFDKVITNAGDAYDPQTGKFVSLKPSK